jgi:phage tail sheath protein FI
MAITGLAPGVYSSIQDLSTFVETSPSTTGFIAMITESGPDNELIRVTSSSFPKLFGEPNLNYTMNREFGMGPYVATNFLSESSNLYVIRCLPSSATYSNIYITTDDVLVPDVSGSVTDTTIGCGIQSYTGLQTKMEVDTAISTGIDDTSLGGYNIVSFRGLGRGEYYNNLLVDINRHPNYSVLGLRNDLYIVDIYQLQKYSNRITAGEADATNGYLYADYSLVESFEVSFDPDAKDEITDSIFIEDVVNNFSNLVRVNTNKIILKEMARRTNLDTGSGKLSINFAGGFQNSFDNTNALALSFGNPMQHGDSGGIFTPYGVNTDTTSFAYPGRILADAYAGILESSHDTTSPVSSVLDTENYLFDIVMDAGYPMQVKTTIAALAQQRTDCLAILDNGDHYTATAAENTRTLGDMFMFNTPYASIYEPYTRIYDVYTGSDIFVPPTFHVAKIVGFNDRTTELWYPLAGFNRAIINNIKEMRFNPTLGDREAFIMAQINPIVKFNTGYALFSQRTTYRKSSALQEIHIIRLQMYINRVLTRFCRNFIFELNDDETRSSIRKEINVILAEIKSKRGLQSYAIDTPMSEYDIKRRRITVEITLQPTRSVEQIHLKYLLK